MQHRHSAQDKDPSAIPHGTEYQHIWRDVRCACIALASHCHPQQPALPRPSKAPSHSQRNAPPTRTRCRSAVDLAHRDGTLKREVAANPSKYIHDVRREWGWGWGGWGGVGWGFGDPRGFGLLIRMRLCQPTPNQPTPVKPTPTIQPTNQPTNPPHHRTLIWCRCSR